MTRSLSLSLNSRFRSFYGLARPPLALQSEDKVHSGKLVDFFVFCGDERERERENFSFYLFGAATAAASPPLRVSLRAASTGGGGGGGGGQQRPKAARSPLSPSPPSVAFLARRARASPTGCSRYNYILQPRGIFADFPMSSSSQPLLSLMPLAAGTPNSLCCCLHIFSSISLAVGRGRSVGRSVGHSRTQKMV